MESSVDRAYVRWASTTVPRTSESVRAASVRRYRAGHKAGHSASSTRLGAARSRPAIQICQFGSRFLAPIGGNLHSKSGVLQGHGLLPAQKQSNESKNAKQRHRHGFKFSSNHSILQSLSSGASIGEPQARNATMEDSGYLKSCRYLLHDRDSKFCREFQDTLKAGGVICTPLPARSPNLNLRGALGAFSERGMFVETDPIWRAVIATGPVRVSNPLSL
jgi:hypothetical protein